MNIDLTILLKIMDICGAIAFAFSGALAAVRAKMDYIGIFMLTCITAIGGGVLRDLILDVKPYTLFGPSHYIMICAIVTVIVLFITLNRIERYTRLILIADAMGLAIFTATTTIKGIDAHAPWYTVIILSLIVACGGGIMRDVLRGEKPLVFYSDFYAGVSILGSLFMMIIMKFFTKNEMLATYLTSIFAFGLRMGVLLWQWHCCARKKIEIEYKGDQ
jgi:uncharacterized membrane protein YeiH